MMDQWIKDWLPENAGRYVMMTVPSSGKKVLGVVQPGKSDLVRGHVMIRLLNSTGQYVGGFSLTEDKLTDKKFKMVIIKSIPEVEQRLMTEVCSSLYAKYRRVL